MGFFGRLKKEIWKVIRGILILGVIISVVVTVFTYGRRISRPEAVTMIIDSDAGHGVDDLFAISLALTDPKIRVDGITAAQWYNHPESDDSTVFMSQQTLEELLILHDRLNIPHPPGEPGPTGFSEKLQSSFSPAAQLILDQVKILDYREKLNVLTLGPPTNLASAILADTTIIPRIRWYGLAGRYDDRSGVWNKNEFNVRNDLDAFDYLLNREALETFILPRNTGEMYLSGLTETSDLLAFRSPKYHFLVEQWKQRYPEKRELPLESLALVQAIMNPDLVTAKEVWTPAENTRRRITVYTWIDAKKMKREYRKLIRKDLGDIASDTE